ncbi:hypothetical protein TBR22_A06410 [Luteitalea sp. TBR-22]|uniref:RDD family protein n=1 Tax=Luteitalea sp. TBR-22 TaxID=2802971 RepID=UPI001AFA41A4|nr:RDD family protein [Luteitalea sp. TBR-22]BCS31440.1 hypothetical protein TBR22_A06410 [Luteitalea sp. TBR-22]
MTTDTYLDQVLAHLPPTTPQRQQIALELRGHIEERLAAGTPLDEVVRQLGAPDVLARSYLAGLPLTPADFGPRLVAKVFDAGAFILAAVVVGGSAWLYPREGVAQVLMLLAIAIAAFGYVTYTIIAEWRTGQTFGKRWFGLSVVQESGAPITLGQAVVRQLSTMLQVFWIDAMFVLFTERRQRAFELLSKTRVVKATPGSV